MITGFSSPSLGLMSSLFQMAFPTRYFWVPVGCLHKCSEATWAGDGVSFHRVLPGGESSPWGACQVLLRTKGAWRSGGKMGKRPVSPSHVTCGGTPGHYLSHLCLPTTLSFFCPVPNLDQPQVKFGANGGDKSKLQRAVYIFPLAFSLLLGQAHSARIFLS